MRRVVVGGALGVGTTVGVSWWLTLKDAAWRSATWMGALPAQGGGAWVLWRWQPHGVPWLEWGPPVPSGRSPVYRVGIGWMPETPPAYAKEQAFADVMAPMTVRVRRWQARIEGEPREDAERWVLWDVRGWPLTALSCRWEWEGTGEPTMAWGIRLPDRSRPIDRQRRLRGLSLRPEWPGFAVNTALYGAAWWGVLSVWPLVRWAQRRWGRPAWVCAGCGYDRRGIGDGAPCPECGAVPAAGAGGAAGGS